MAKPGDDPLNLDEYQHVVANIKASRGKAMRRLGDQPFRRIHVTAENLILTVDGASDQPSRWIWAHRTAAPPLLWVSHRSPWERSFHSFTTAIRSSIEAAEHELTLEISPVYHFTAPSVTCISLARFSPGRFVNDVLQQVELTLDTFFTGYVSLRFTSGSRAQLAMQQWPHVCAVEMSVLKGITGLHQLFQNIGMIAILSGHGLPHWGQLLDIFPGRSRRLYPKYRNWRNAYARLSSGFTRRTFENDLSVEWLLTVPGTSPSLVALPGGGYEVAFQEANIGNLQTVVHGDAGFGMMAGTSPSLVTLPTGGFEVAFQANTGILWTMGHGNAGFGMMAGTSPSIITLPSGGFEVAFQANTGNLWTVGITGDQNQTDWKLKMKAGTSPSIVALPMAGFDVAFQANTGNLWTVVYGDSGLGMMPGTSPSIVAYPTGEYAVAFQGSNGNLWTVGVRDSGRGAEWVQTDWQLGMMAGTSPSIVALPTGGYVVAFQADTGNLWTVSTEAAENHGEWQLGMM